jgi:hypothetical protein
MTTRETRPDFAITLCIITNPMIDAAEDSKAYFTASSILLMPNSMYCTIDMDAEKRTMREDVAAAA